MSVLRKLARVLALFVSSALAIGCGETVVIHDVTVLGVDTGSRTVGANIWIEGERIKTVNKLPPNAADATLIDGTGLYAIPGLWDMHVHAFWSHEHPKRMLPLFIANGVTGIRDLGSPLPFEDLRRMREEASAPGAVPHILSAYKLVDGRVPVWPGSIALSTSAEARSAIRDLEDAVADVVKVYARLSRDSYFAVLEEARRRELPVVGHVPLSVSALEAAQAGQRTIEHSSELLLACSSLEDELRSALLSAASSAERNRLRAEQLPILVQSFDRRKAVRLAGEFRRNGTWQTPTLVVNRTYAYPPAGGFAQQPGAQYLSSKTLEDYASRVKGYRDSLTSEQLAAMVQAYEKEVELIGLMRSEGVGFLTGTDADLFGAAGYGVHCELELLVEIGFTELEALRAATLNPAKSMNRLADFGTVSPGRFADLILLDADPLGDIKNTTRIVAVVVRGKVFNRTELDRMLRAVQEISDSDGRHMQED